MPPTQNPTPLGRRLPQTDTSWWRDGVLYQIYPRSFQDSDGDGVGDLRGVIERLDHLVGLGVSGIWLNPIHPSPNVDWGYDVADYYDVDATLGGLAAFDALVHAAHARGLRVIMDLVANHTSDHHPWFRDACSGRDAAHRDYYVWADPGPDGGPPNNWISMFGGSAWRWHAPTEQFYLHNFTPAQPDLNWWCDDVRAEFDRILRFWLERGVDGFRLDACQALVKDRALRDNPPATAEDRRNVRLRGQRPTRSMNRPEVHAVLRRWRHVVDKYGPDRILLGETNTHNLEALARYYGDHAGDELHMAFNFPFMNRSLEAAALREVIERTEALLPAHAQPVWALSNHDASRYVTRWCDGDQENARTALTLLLSLRGTPMLYYGDELAMGDVTVPPERARDWLAAGTLPGKPGRDPSRTPMRWDDEAGGGFSSGAPWLPMGDDDAAADSVAAQRATADSTLRYCRELIALRAAYPELRSAPIAFLDGPEGTLTLRRGPRLIVLLNLRDRPWRPAFAGRVLLASSRGHEDVPTIAPELAPWQAAIVELADPHHDE